jgi:glycosyltransferase involved in cell wall biosynthesis
MKFCVFSSDPLYKYYEKGELKRRYWNPENIFAEVHVFSFCRQDIAPDKVQVLAGDARLEITPLGPPSMARLFAQYRQAVKKLKALRPDVVRVHNPWHAGLIGVQAARKLRIPVVLSLHTHYDARRAWERRWLLEVLRLCEKYVISRVDQVLCVSHYLTDYAWKMGARSVQVIYNRVYAEQFQCQRAAFNRRPVVLSVGRLDPPKNQECLIRALARLDVELLLVGEGVNRPSLETLVKELDMEDRVKFAGAVPHERIQGYYARADIFAMATFYEGFCMPVLEAMASGMPIVVCDTPPLPEVLGDCGMVVGHHPEDFRRAIEHLLENQEKALALGQRARQRALALDGAQMERRERELYEELADFRPRGAE